jgi:hypothetical protein
MSNDGNDMPGRFFRLAGMPKVKQRLLAAVFGFVSGHDFSRAVKEGERIGLQPLLWRFLPEMLA